MSSAARLASLCLLLLWACSDGSEGAPRGARRDLFLDQANVELLEGYEGYDGFVIEHDPAVNPDRDEVALPLFRNGRFVWHVGARPGRFLAGVCRLGVGPGADDTPCALVLTVTPPGDDPSPVEHRWQVPAMPADPTAPPAAWHEGPVLELDLPLPDGAASLTFQFVTPLPVPDGSNVALLSPRVLLDAGGPPADAEPLVHEWATRLAHTMEGSPEPRLFAHVRFAPGVDPKHHHILYGEDEPNEEAERVSYPAYAPDGSFSGRDARTSFAILGGERATFEPLAVGRGQVLRTALALDARLPPDTVARVVFDVDGIELAAYQVSSASWLAVELSLDGHVGTDRRLGVRAETVALGELPVPGVLPDYVHSAFVPVEWHDPARVRVGLADLRIARDERVPRRPADGDRPSVVLIQVETLRGDLVGAVGDDGELIMPHLTALARAGEHHGLAMAPSPWTVPSTATLFTGLPPASHGMIRHDRAFVPDAAVTLAERARAQGVTTGAVVTNDLVRRHAGWDRGFETFAQVPYANARQVTDLALSIFDRHAGSQQLLYLHYWDPHGPYNAPGAWRDRYVDPELADRDYAAAERRAAYDPHWVGPIAPDDPDARFLRQRYLGDVAYFDHWLGVLLEALIARGLADTTTVVLTADHGEEFFEHGMFGHGNQVYDESVHVPLVIARAGRWADAWTHARAAGDRGPVPGDDRLVSTGGLAAEVLDELGVPHAADELLPALSDARDEGHIVVSTEKGIARLGRLDPFRRRVEAVRDGRHLLLVRHPVPLEQGEDPPPRDPDPSGLDPGPDTWLFDLQADPAALRPADATGPAARALRRKLEAWHAWAEEHALPELAGSADWATLSALGYLGGMDGH